MLNVTVLFFATLKNLAGVDKTAVDLSDGATVSDLKAYLRAHYPALAPALETALVAVNREYAFDGDRVPDQAEVALFPPVSGGKGEEKVTRCEITEVEVDLNAVLAEITRPTTGAACFFTGMVRAKTSREVGYQTQYLEYEAYRPMAEAKLHQVANEIRTRWPAVEGIAIVQRVGRLFPGTPTVMIACTAGHRDSGVFEAARYGIDRLKEIVPIWKKEVGPGGEYWVEGDYIPQPGE